MEAVISLVYTLLYYMMIRFVLYFFSCICEIPHLRSESKNSGNSFGCSRSHVNDQGCNFFHNLKKILLYDDSLIQLHFGEKHSFL